LRRWLAGLLFLRQWRCTTACGWKGLRLSRSQLRRRKKRLRTVLFVAVFATVAALTIRYVLSHGLVGSGAATDEGIQEVE
jgi:ABC-type maltose transport system permease subunit